MTKIYGPFDTGTGANMRESEWREMAANYIRSGIVEDYLNELAVSATGASMDVSINSGASFTKSHFYRNDAAETITIPTSDPTNPRIDLLVVRADFTGNIVDTALKVGTPAGVPVVPPLVDSATMLEIALAQIAVAAGVGVINNGNITDRRVWAAATIPTGAIVAAMINAALIDPVVASPGLRTLGTGAQQAAAGDHSHASTPQDNLEAALWAGVVNNQL